MVLRVVAGVLSMIAGGALTLGAASYFRRGSELLLGTEDPATNPEDPEDPAEPEDPEDPAEPEDPEDPAEPEDPEDPAELEDPEDPAELEELERRGDLEELEPPSTENPPPATSEGPKP